MTFKKGSVIVDKKNKRGRARCILLAADFNPKVDQYISYVNCFIITTKPRTKRVVKKIFSIYEDNCEGEVFSGDNYVWYLASSKLTELVLEKIKQINQGIYCSIYR